MLQAIIKKLSAYFRRLLFPLYLFPLKLITYTLYYLLRSIGRLAFALLLIFRDMLVYPFLSLRYFLKTICLFLLILYIFGSLLAIMDYLVREYGSLDKISCALNNQSALKSKVVRIVGSNSEGSGFFIADNRVLTNFHVIEGESSPKIIFPDGKFTFPITMVGDKNIDLAILITSDNYSEFVLPLPTEYNTLADDEPVLSIGYPMGTDLTGDATVHRGRFINFRNSSLQPTTYIQTDITVVLGMSGGPLTDICGKVIGVNTMGVAGLSLFIDGYHANLALPTFTDADITKTNYDPKNSPEESVRAFYNYIMARDLLSGYNLLSSEYKKFTNLDEWTSRFTDILAIDVVLIESVPDVKNTIFVKFVTKTWTGTEAIFKFYEGVWVTVLEDGIYKMRRSMIKEVFDPTRDWTYSGPEF